MDSANQRVNVCVNCSYPLIKNSGDCTDFDLVPQNRIIMQEILVNQNLNEFQQETIKVDMVLSSIYKLNYLNPKQNVCKKIERELIPFLDQQVGVCELCADVLIHLYEYYHKFNCLRQSNSLLNKTIVRLDEYIQQLELVDSNTKLSTMATTDSSQVNKFQSVNVDQIQENDNDFFHDMSTLMECDFNEGGPDETHFEESHLNENDNDNVHVNHPIKMEPQSCDLIIEPIVKLKRISQAEIKAATAIGTRSKKKDPKRRVKIKIQRSSLHDGIKSCHDNHIQNEEDEKDRDFEIESEGGQGKQKTAKLSSKKKSFRKSKRIPPTKYIHESDSDDPEADPESWKCILCSELFEKSTDLSKHLLIHVPDDSKTQCDLCSENFSNRWSLLDHFRGKHCQVGNFICPICPKSYNTRRRRNVHLKGHWSSNQFACRTCLSVFPSRSQLQDHESECGDKPCTNHPCPSISCSEKLFTSENILNEHLKKDHAGQKLYSCPVPPCPNTFYRKRHMNRHVKFHHTAKQSVECGKGCGKRFESEKNLQKHQETCLGLQMKICEICSKQFKSPEGYHWHMKIHSQDRQTFICQQPNCGKIFYRKSNLKQHQQAHNSERPFTCERCGKCFQNERILREHFLVHEASKNHLCSHCGKSFLRPSGLTKHLKTHSEERQYNCTVCQKTFKYSESLRLHFLLQHQEAQFVCSVCGAGFPYKFNLQKHMRTLHPDQIQPQETS